MKIYIVADLAGVAGITNWRQLSDGESGANQEARRLLTGEVNAAIQGILDAVLQVEIVVWDATNGGGLLFPELHPEGRVILDGGNTAVPPLLDSSFDAMILIGQHAMAGTPNSPLAHTFTRCHVATVKLNGIAIGEVGAIAAQAGAVHVPILVVSGDAGAISEAKALLSDTATVETRTGIDNRRSVHRSSERVRHDIRESVAKAIKKIRVAESPGAISPRRLEVERKILSAMLWGGGETIARVASLIAPSDLRQEEHPPVFAAMVALTEQGRPLDVITLQYELRRMECLDLVGREFLLHLAEVTSDPAQIDDYLSEFQNCDQPDRDHLPIFRVEPPYKLEVTFQSAMTPAEEVLMNSGFEVGKTPSAFVLHGSDLSLLFAALNPFIEDGLFN